MPLVRRTWAPRGQPPLFRHRTNSYRKVSVIAALAVSPARDRVQLFFRLHPQENINAGKVLSFLKDLSRHFECPLSLLWDRFMPHRARCVQRYIALKKDWRLEFLPAYAPELNHRERLVLPENQLMANEAIFEDELLTNSGSATRPSPSKETISAPLIPEAHAPFFAFKIGHYLCRCQ